MRRWFAIFLLALLPLQFSWAAVVGLCDHKAGQQTQQGDHHENRQADLGSMGSDGEAANQDGQAIDACNGCEHCHGICCCMPASVHRLTARVVAVPSAVLVPGVLRTLAAAPPERPQWLRFA